MSLEWGSMIGGHVLPSFVRRYAHPPDSLPLSCGANPPPLPLFPNLLLKRSLERGRLLEPCLPLRPKLRLRHARRLAAAVCSRLEADTEKKRRRWVGGGSKGKRVTAGGKNQANAGTLFN